MLRNKWGIKKKGKKSESWNFFFFGGNIRRKETTPEVKGGTAAPAGREPESLPLGSSFLGCGVCSLVKVKME